MKRYKGKLKSRSLKDLTASELGVVIQSGEHSALEDARATLYIYQRHQNLWLDMQPPRSTDAKSAKQAST
jgi:DNA polymerase III epsilon subunit-like protein